MTKSKDVYEDKVVLEQMKTMYQAAQTDDERTEVVAILVKQLGKPKASVIGKLGALKVYVAKQRTTKSGGKIVRKWEIVDQICDAANLELTDAEADSLAKATKTTLEKILARFVEVCDISEGEKSEG